VNDDGSTPSLVIVGQITRRRGKAVELVEGSPPVRKTTRPLRVARTLALAHIFRDLIDAGVVRDQAELAAVTGFTRARITQMLDLTLLAPDIQERLLVATLSVGQAAVPERALRAATRCILWNDQRASLPAAIMRGPQTAGNEAQTMSA